MVAWKGVSALLWGDLVRIEKRGRRLPTYCERKKAVETIRIASIGNTRSAAIIRCE